MRNIKLGKKDKSRLNKFVKEFYTMIIEYSEVDKLFCISFPDLPECIAKGETVKEALKNVESAKWTWGVACIINEHDLPKPKNKRTNEQYIFIRLSDDELYKLNEKAWENRKVPELYAKSTILEKISLFETEIELSDSQIIVASPQDVGTVFYMVKQKGNKKQMNAGASQVAFAG